MSSDWPGMARPRKSLDSPKEEKPKKPVPKTGMPLVVQAQVMSARETEKVQEMVARQEVREIARNFVDNPTYLENLKIRFQQGTLHPSLEQMLWAYAYGKPSQRVEVDTEVTLVDVLRAARNETP